MKKFCAVLLSLAVILTIPIPAFAANNNSGLEKISDGFGIPVEVLEGLDSETIQSLYHDVTTNRLVSAADSYIKVVETESGDIIMEEASYEQYLSEKMSRVGKTDESSGWMRFQTTVYEVDSTTGLAACAFTWLTPPSPRMTDVVGISLRNGTTKAGTTNGFYSHTSPNDDYDYTFTDSDIRETGAGATATFKLRRSDYVSEANDFVFLRLNFTKDGAAEGVNGTYAHQKISIVFSPSFSIDRLGAISLSGGFNIVNYYAQDTGYVDITW